MSKAKKTCPNCDEMELTRIARSGFMQERIYPKLGMFPWECGQCRQVFLLKSRGRSYRKASPRADIGVAVGRLDSAGRAD
jgi:hypothetical protein